MIFLAQQVQGGGCSYHSPPSSPASYGYTNVTKPNRESNRLWIKISEQRKKSRLILQSGMYIFSVTNNISKAEHGLSSSESTYKWLGQAKTLQNSVNKYKWKEGITFHLFFCAVGNFFFKFFFSFSFRQWRCLIWKLNSKGNLTRKQLNFEFFAEGGGSSFCFTNLSEFKLRYLRSYMRHCKTFFSFKLPVIRSLRKNQKIWEIQNFKINVRMTLANMTS